MKVIIRRSNIVKTESSKTPAYRALAWIERPGNRRLAFVTLHQEPEDPRRLIQHDVIIDGTNYFCVDVRTFTPGPYGRGDSVGILVAGA